MWDAVHIKYFIVAFYGLIWVWDLVFLSSFFLKKMNVYPLAWASQRDGHVKTNGPPSVVFPWLLCWFVQRLGGRMAGSDWRDTSVPHFQSPTLTNSVSTKPLSPPGFTSVGCGLLSAFVFSSAQLESFIHMHCVLVPWLSSHNMVLLVHRRRWPLLTLYKCCFPSL